MRNKKVLYLFIAAVIVASVVGCNSSGSSNVVSTSVDELTAPPNSSELNWMNIPRIGTVEMSDQETIWAITEVDRKLIVSRDFGKNWSEVDGLSNARLVDFTDGTNGWVIAGDSELYVTVDAGQSWRKQSRPFVFSLPRKLKVISPLTGWVWDENRLLYSRDEGITWDEVKKVSGEDDLASGDFSFLNSKQGWLCDVGPKGGFVLKTTDAGGSWSTFELPARTGHPCEIFFATDKAGWVRFGRLNTQELFTTVDGGNRWQRLQSIPEGFGIRSMFWQTEAIGFIVGQFHKGDIGGIIHDRPGLFRTVDGGQTWDEIRFEGEAAFFDKIRFLGASEGVLTSRDSIFVTVDGGKSWTRSLTLSPLSD
jgi:photosystem II stability/assembly factor-like uncharacterized protein